MNFVTWERELLCFRSLTYSMVFYVALLALLAPEWENERMRTSVGSLPMILRSLPTVLRGCPTILQGLPMILWGLPTMTGASSAGIFGISFG